MICAWTKLGIFTSHILYYFQQILSSNHLTTKKYYEDMFLNDIPPKHRTGNFLEKKMHQKAAKQCDKYGPHIYGGIGSPHVILHLDGRRNGKDVLPPGFPPKSLWKHNKELIKRMKREQNMTR